VRGKCFSWNASVVVRGSPSFHLGTEAFVKSWLSSQPQRLDIRFSAHYEEPLHPSAIMTSCCYSARTTGDSGTALPGNAMPINVMPAAKLHAWIARQLRVPLS